MAEKSLCEMKHNKSPMKYASPELRVKNENVDAAASPSKEKPPPNVDDERLAKIQFNCVACGMREMVHYFGTAPPFVGGVKLREPTYILRDPLQPPPPRWKAKPEYFIALGAHCSICSKILCRGTQCSFFYTRTFCFPCAWENLSSFPIEVQQKLRKCRDT